MTRKDKIAFIKSSGRKTHKHDELPKMTQQELDTLLREVVQGLIRESEIMANAYLNKQKR